MHHESPQFVVCGVQMVGRVIVTARATQWACAVASVVSGDRILMLLMILK
jgi:hypothetical protein